MSPPPAFDPALDALVTPVLRADRHGRVVACNQAFARWLGVSQKRLPDQPLVALEAEGDGLRGALQALDEADGSRRLRRVALAFLGGEPRFADVWLTREADGGTLLEAHPVDEFPGEDPTRALPLALSAALKGLAHELRNPLAGLKGAAQLLGRRAGDADSRELVDLIATEVQRLTQLVDQLMSPAPPRPHQPLNIHGALEQVVRLAEQEAGWAVRLVRDYDPSLPPLRGDPDRLTQAVWNLVRNAIQAGAANVSLRTRAEFGVRIGEQVHALALRMEIVDDGRGVPEALAEQIFLPLVSGRADGSGLGLAMAQQVAREHGGSLGYRSRPGHTVFTLLLPLPDGDGDDPPPAADRAAKP
ncbi:ATP-binding protein [Luteimonas sp. M1R5S18]|jgi:two-component system nitrogen regulation sensor histidine kinase GlnL|uniref:Sensory histidine kinase/phosphatase NtrB n=1 Tax=Luteimonas rhizosphaericola TaxID=3042024 RepID=A0ABT6JL58_9GAMM|nr:ATP-binding protein [Luteimonas rhizosphaericola]MDH5831409.1 ATP-binding protein [Luteimonas rhizosphaericola]